MYTIKEVSALLGMPAVTIRAWENRYQAVVPGRTESGYRLYDPGQVEELKWLKDQTENKGLSIRQAAELLKQHRSRSGHAGHGDSARKRIGDGLSDAHHEHLEALYALLTEFRTEEAHHLLELGFTMYGYETMVYRVLVNLMIRVGDDWENGVVSVAQEHYMTHFVIQRCFRFFTVFPVNPDLPKAIAFCPPGEQHHTGLLLFSLFLRKRGLEVLYLGPNTPEDGLRHMVTTQDIHLACVSLTDRRLQGAALAFIDRLAGGLGGLEFVLGGFGFEDVPQPYASWLLPPDKDIWESWLDRKLNSG